MKIKTNEATGPVLDWLVAAALNAQHGEDRVIKVCRRESGTPAWIERENYPGSAPIYHRFAPSTDWQQGEPIIDRDNIAHSPSATADSDEAHRWAAEMRDTAGKRIAKCYGPTPLIAAMRCYVASKLGEEIDIPDELLA